MADINVKLGDQPVDATPAEKEKKSQKFNIKLNARRTLDGNIIVMEHPEIDIAIIPDKMKIVTFAKDHFDDTVYEAQNRLFKYLFKKGVIVFDSICGGNIYASLEAKIQKPSSEYPIDDIILMLIAKWIEEEKPSLVYQKSVEDAYIDDLTEPDEENSSELGDVPAADEKGSVPIHQVRRYAYGL